MLDKIKEYINKIKECFNTNKTTIAVNKQYTIFYTIGSDPKFFVSNATDYKLSTIDIQSLNTNEIYSYPVIFGIDEEADTMDIIPFAAVSNLKYNWGYKKESEKFANNTKELKKKMTAVKKKNTDLSGKIDDAVKPKDQDNKVLYG